MRILFYSIVAAVALLFAFAVKAQEKCCKPRVTNDATILHAWCWSFNTIKENMKDIAAAGYTYVQTSPANTCFVGEDGGMQIFGHGKWYYHYQPCDWKIGNYQLGTRDEFIAMCAEAKKNGVKVLVDVLPNHTGFDTTAVAEDFIKAVGGRENLYHANGLNPIKDYNDRWDCTTGGVGGLPDVNTENPDFQHYFMLYVNDLIACGANGFRYDTAKHIGLPSDPLDAKSKQNDFWDVAMGRKPVKRLTLANKDSLFIYGEVLQDRNVKEEEYGQYFGMCASNYGGAIRHILETRTANLDQVTNWQHSVCPAKLTTWVESHDTYCNANESASLTDTQVRLGWVIITARQNGIPLFYSRPDGRTPENIWGNNLMGAKGNDEFKHPEVVAVNKFRKAMNGEFEKVSILNDGKVVVIARGNKGVAIVNLSTETQEINVETALADKKYKDVVYGNKFTAKKGKLTAKLAPEKSYIIY